MPLRVVLDALKLFLEARCRNWRWDIYNSDREWAWRPWSVADEQEEERHFDDEPVLEQCDVPPRQTPEADFPLSEHELDDPPAEFATPEYFRQVSLDAKLCCDEGNVWPSRTIEREGEKKKVLSMRLWANSDTSRSYKGRAAFVPWGPMEIARFLVPRLGVDFGRDSGPKTASEAKEVHTWLLQGDAVKAETYEALVALGGTFRNRTFELILVDPPFGLKKHSVGDDDWDAPGKRWGHEQVKALLKALHTKGLLKPLDTAFSVAVYLQMEDIGGVVNDIKKWAAEVDFLELKGHFVIVLGREGVAPLMKGTSTNGHQQHMLVLKFQNGHNGVRADDIGGGLGGRFIFSFPKPTASSRYGRPELDASLNVDSKVAYNATQKPIDEARLLVRLLAPDGGCVLSACNGTGTTLVAAALEGRDSVGVDTSSSQTMCAQGRVQTMFVRENLLRAALASGRSDVAVNALKASVRDSVLVRDTEAFGTYDFGPNVRKWIEKEFGPMMAGHPKRYCVHEVLLNDLLSALPRNRMMELENTPADEISELILPTRDFTALTRHMRKTDRTITLAVAKKVVKLVYLYQDDEDFLLAGGDSGQAEKIISEVWKFVPSGIFSDAKKATYTKELPEKAERRELQLVSEDEVEEPEVPKGEKEDDDATATSDDDDHTEMGEDEEGGDMDTEGQEEGGDGDGGVVASDMEIDGKEEGGDGDGGVVADKGTKEGGEGGQRLSTATGSISLIAGMGEIVHSPTEAAVQSLMSEETQPEQDK